MQPLQPALDPAFSHLGSFYKARPPPTSRSSSCKGPLSTPLTRWAFSRTSSRRRHALLQVFMSKRHQKPRNAPTSQRQDSQKSIQNSSWICSLGDSARRERLSWCRAQKSLQMLDVSFLLPPGVLLTIEISCDLLVSDFATLRQQSQCSGLFNISVYNTHEGTEQLSSGALEIVAPLMAAFGLVMRVKSLLVMLRRTSLIQLSTSSAEIGVLRALPIIFKRMVSRLS